MNKPLLNIWTDGACRNNGKQDNIGAWAFVLKCREHEKTQSEWAVNTTNNQMELVAVIQALSTLKLPSANNYKIVVHSDSEYVIHGWVAKNFIGVKNASLWKELYELTQKFSDLHFVHVDGHSGVEENELADRLCNISMDIGAHA